MFYIKENKLNCEFEKGDLVKLDSSNFFGRGVFETILLKRKCVFLEEHLERLREGCKILDLECNISKEEVESFVERENIKNKALKITVTEKNIIISLREIPYNKKNYDEGFALKISKVLRNSTSNLTYIKSTCYVENLIEKEKGRKEGFSEVIFLNERGEITEGATSNLFFLKENNIYTPKVRSGLLNGIIRKWIIKNYSVIEGSYTLEDLKNSDGIFLTNSLMGIMKVNRLENLMFNENRIIEDIRIKYERSLKEFL
ncbi:aminotransferase class IV [Clostridium sp.]|uniref:aminotransferase class IV n=1 Tax=Clostridium sp. TaxID=1506 RepID=UPI00262E1FF0|nr:aminotransferase class IV [Clostridium sp.]